MLFRSQSLSRWVAADVVESTESILGYARDLDPLLTQGVRLDNLGCLSIALQSDDH